MHLMHHLHLNVLRLLLSATILDTMSVALADAAIQMKLMATPSQRWQGLGKTNNFRIHAAA